MPTETVEAPENVVSTTPEPEEGDEDLGTLEEALIDDPTEALTSPPSDEVTLTTGQKVKIKRLKARQFFAMLRILTRNLESEQLGVIISKMDDENVFGPTLTAALLFAMPEADDEVADFLWSMVEKPSKKHPSYKTLEDAITGEDAELEDWISIVEVIVPRETHDMVSLGKRLQQMFSLAQKTGQFKVS